LNIILVGIALLSYLIETECIHEAAISAPAASVTIIIAPGNGYGDASSTTVSIIIKGSEGYLVDTRCVEYLPARIFLAGIGGTALEIPFKGIRWVTIGGLSMKIDGFTRRKALQPEAVVVYCEG
jgi:hypothetical protein